MEQTKNRKPIIIAIITITLFFVAGGFIVINKIKQEPQGKEAQTQTENLQKENALYQKDISSIVIRYAPMYNISTAEALNEIEEGGYIEIRELTLQGEDFQNIKKLIENLQPNEAFADCDCMIMDEVEVIINDEYLVSFDATFGYAGFMENDRKIGESIVVGTRELYQEITKLVDEDFNKILEKISSEPISIEKEKNTINITKDEDKKKLLDNLNYIRVNNNDNYLTYDEIASVINFKDGKKLYVYKVSIIGYLLDPFGDSSFVVIKSKADRYDKIVDRIYENNLPGKN